MKEDPDPAPQSSRPEATYRWERRVVLLAVVVIAVATLFPYQLLPKETVYRRTVPLFFWLNPSPTNLRDFLENVLLFVPFGFGIASWTARKDWQRFWGVLAALALGAAFSFTLEYIQVFLPTRTAEWWDVISNSTGSVLGYLIFDYAGQRICSYASAIEARLQTSVTRGRIALCFVAYFGLMLYCSAQLQRSTNLARWHQDDLFFVGNDSTNRHPWQGRILKVEMANELVSPDYFARARSEAAQSADQKETKAPHVVLDLSADGNQGSGDESRIENPHPDAGGLSDGSGNMDSIRAEIPGTDLVNDLIRTNRFALRIVCIPSKAAKHSFGTIISIARDSLRSDFYLNDIRGRWVLGIRSEVAGISRYWYLVLRDIPIKDEPVEIFITFDGSDLVATVNGRTANQPLRLYPGANLVLLFKGVDPLNVHGYGLVYDGLVFAPLGLLLAIAARISFSRSHFARVLMAAGFLLPPALLETALMLVSARPFQFGNILIGEGLILGTFLIWNADCKSLDSSQQSKTLPNPSSLNI